jgi:hypothetical protein
MGAGVGQRQERGQRQGAEAAMGAGGTTGCLLGMTLEGQGPEQWAPSEVVQWGL